MITIIIPTFNRANTYLRQAIESAVSQDYPKKVLVVDDGSTDNTAEVVKEYPVEYLWKENEGHLGGGETHVVTFALKALSTPYWTVLHDDNYLLPNSLAKIMGMAPKFDVLHTGGIIKGTRDITYHPPVISLSRILKEEYLHWAFYIYSDAVYKKLGYGHPNKDVVMVFDWYYKILTTKYFDVQTLDVPLSVFRIHGARMSNSSDQYVKMEKALAGMKANLLAEHGLELTGKIN